MAYTAPAGDAVHFQFPGGTYSAPSGDAVAFTHAPVPTATVEAVLPLTADVTATFGLPTASGTVDAVLPLTGDVQVFTGTIATVAAVLPLTAAVQGIVPRYILKGVVKDGNTLVDRRVRVYRRSTGELVTQGDTTGGAFEFAVGTTQDEYLILPVDLSAGATDWAPPCANRVLSVLLTD